jgi:hypothetical protein
MDLQERIRDLANTVALQADALARGDIAPELQNAHVRKISNNVDTLITWVTGKGDRR